MDVSIIIPVKKLNHHIEESIPYIKNLDYKDYEILILTDHADKAGYKGVKIIPTGEVGPAEKRDIAAEHAQGEILAFLDDDAYPRKDWLTNAVKHFDNKSIAAVCGPGVTPSNDGLFEKASGLVLSNKIGGGGATYRYVPGKKQYVDDFPSVNFLIRKEVFEKVGGFDTHYWPGEDTKLCLDVINLGYKILYDPDVLVYHHRRKLFLPHLKQIIGYATHRGYFVKKFPKTSLKLGYFIPSLFLIFIIFGLIFSWFNSFVFITFISLLSLYFLLVIISSIKNDISLSALIVWGTILTHLSYGIFFIKGLVSRRLP